VSPNGSASTGPHGGGDDPAATKTFVALFRGINVGGKNTLPAKDLVTLMKGMGLEEIRTYIQSGNVVFQSAAKRLSNITHEIRDAIDERFGFRPKVIVLDAAGLHEAIAANPFSEANSEPRTVHLTFLSALPEDPDLESLERLRAPRERFELTGGVFYLHAPDGIGRSKLAARLEKELGVPGTSRNWRTVLRLEEMIGEADRSITKSRRV
jgi:uncharacterized protein (DUF1697 family)